MNSTETKHKEDLKMT